MEEEIEHYRFAVRDLQVLESGPGCDGLPNSHLFSAMDSRFHRGGGLRVSERGRIPARIIEQYEAAAR